MNYFQTLLIYLFPMLLAMSYFPVGLNNSRGGKPLKPGTPMKISIVFALTAFLMLLAGYYIAGLLRGRMEGYGHWAAFMLILFIGVRIIMPAFRKKSGTMVFDIEQFGVIFPLALALSFNPFFAGVALQFLALPIMIFAILLFAMVWLFSFSGLMYGNQFSEAFGVRLEIITGAGFILLAFAFQLVF
jgi:manganese efflux pump family protein